MASEPSAPLTVVIVDDELDFRLIVRALLRGLADGVTIVGEAADGEEALQLVRRTRPDLLICDEPTGDLDRENAEQIMQVLQQLNREHGKTIIMATHDPQAAKYATQVMLVGKAREPEAATGRTAR